MINDKGNLAAKASKFIIGLGGKDNILNIDNCITRLRIKIKDTATIDKKALSRQGALGFIFLEDNMVQVVVSPVSELAEEIKKQL
jgi:PTS system N-acetylglucosamine-specific IIC component